jgi:hypothetical protein
MEMSTSILTYGLILVMALSQNGGVLQGAETAENLFPSFADKHTVALWLFDEGYYPHTTLTDASTNRCDLRLQDGGRLVEGRFGNALKVLSGSEHAVSYAGTMGDIGGRQMREKDGIPSGLWGPAVTPEKLLSMFSRGTWTCEFWLKFGSAPSNHVVVLDIGYAYNAGVTISCSAGARSFEITDAYAGFKAVCATDSRVLGDGKWHHIAFTRSASRSAVRHYVDGRKQAEVTLTPIKVQRVSKVRRDDSSGFSKEKSFDWRRQHRFNIAAGHDRQGGNRINGMIDEIRLSDVVRYSKNFGIVGTHSRNYGAHAPKPAVANGPPLLFAADAAQGVVKVGGRKHVFIDDAIIERMENVRFVCNPPTNRRVLNFSPDDSDWRATVVDVDGKVYMYIPEGYGSDTGITRLRISEDGVNFKTPNLGVVSFEGSTNNDYVFAGEPMYSTFFRDLNPNIGAEETYKMTGWIGNRGIYLYMSPDGIHWRRNETCMLPLVSGGGAETYWDDQRGLYIDYIKRDASFRTEEYGGGGRRACMFETSEIHKTWPFKKLEKPYYEQWTVPAVTGEGPVVMGPNKNGQVYRTRAIKYPWADDTYVAFVWRYEKEDQRRKVDLGVSRDGINWKFYADDTWYMTPGSDEEVLSLYGLIRRGDEIWQYADYGGAHGGGRRRTYARLTQRLDGFVSLDAGAKSGWVTTRPLIFRGRRLMLNVVAQGSVRLAILDEKGNELKGFGLADCDPVIGDATSYLVSWQKNTDVGSIGGKVVRLKFELQDAKLYAFKFD